ncbi:MAG: transcription antitermination factor NusB, partial [Catalinimonas sp.]
LQGNPLLAKLRDSPTAQAAFARAPVRWPTDGPTPPLPRHLYREAVRNDETYQRYRALASPTLGEHFDVLRYLYRHVICKHELAVLFFEERDLNWAENSDVVRSLGVRTLKSMRPDQGEAGEPEIPPLSYNWEDDKRFFVALYETTLDQDEELEALITARADNWAADRIATLDKILLKLAVSEMIHFSSIPVKVSINEYIEISKRYSTPKSKQFVNGLLDVLAQNLKAEGRIRKSGRGLLDNR